MHEILICADHGEFLKLSVAGRSHSDCNDYWDGNWLRATVDVRASGFRGSVDGDIRAGELVAFCGQLAQLQKSLQGVAGYDTLADWLSIRATGDGLGHIEIRCVVLYQPGIGNKLEFTLASDQTFMKQTIDQLTEATKAFPVIGRA
jgi:hypothetical protein